MRFTDIQTLPVPFTTPGDVPMKKLRLGDKEVYLQFAPTDIAADQMHRLECHLTDDERSRAERLNLTGARQRFVVARGVLRQLLGKHFDCAPQTLDIQFGPYGKPFLGGALGKEAIHFNVAHSGNWALIGIANGAEIGVDIEELRTNRSLERIALRAFGPLEVALLQKLSGEQFLETFYRIWTVREAFLKGTGRGLAGASGHDIVVGPASPVSPKNSHSDWQAYRIDAPCLGAVALPRGDWRFTAVQG